MPIAGAIWFLPCLAWANLIFEIVDKTGEKAQLILCLVLLCIGIYWERFVGIEMPLAFSASFVAVFFFYAGNVIKKRNLERYIEKIPVWTMLIMLIFNAALILKTGYVNMRVGRYPQVALFICNSLCAIVLLWRFSMFLSSILENNTHREWLQNIGKYSIIYLGFNQLVILMLRYILDFFDLSTTASNVVVFISAVLILKTIELGITKSPYKRLLGI